MKTTYSVMAVPKDIPDLVERLEACEDINIDEAIFGSHEETVLPTSNPLAGMKPVIAPTQALDQM